MSRRIWLVRHGYRQDYVNPAWSYVSSHPGDTPLSKRGMRQAQDLASAFPIRPDHVFVSPYRRAIETAQPLVQTLKLPVYIEPGLGEIYNQYNTFSRTPEQHQHLVPELNLAHRSLCMPPPQESRRMAMERAAKTVNLLLEKFPGNLLFICHETPIRGVAAYLLQTKVSVQCAFCGITELQKQGSRWRLVRNGDVSHLSDPITTQRFLWDYIRRKSMRIFSALPNVNAP